MIQLPADALRRARRAVVRVEVDGAVPCSAMAAVGEVPHVVVRPFDEAWPADAEDPKALHAAQRETRTLGRELQRAATGAGFRAELHVFLACPPAVALDVGRRLASWDCTVYTGAGWAPGRPEAEAPAMADALRLLPPDDAASAFALGRALARVPARSIILLVQRDGEHVEGLQLVGPPLLGQRGSGAAAQVGLEVARAAAISGDPGRGLDALRPLRGTAEDTANTALVRAHMLHQLGDLDGAAEETAVALGLAPDDARIRVRAGQKLLGIGRPAEADLQALEALRLDPTQGAALALRVEALVASGRPDEAVEPLLQLTEIQPDDRGVIGAAWVRLAQTWERQERLHEALEAGERALAFNDTVPLAWLLVQGCRVRLGRIREGLARLQDGLARLPDALELHVRFASVLLAHNDVDRALAAAERGLALAPQEPELLDVRAEAAARSRHPDTAAFVAAALAVAPDRWEAALERLLMAGDIEAAVALAEEAPGVRGEVARARFALWRADADEAETLARRALGAQPDDLQASLVLAGVEVLRGRPEQALRCLDEVLPRLRKAGPDGLSEAYVWRAEACRALGQPEAARADASQAMTTSRGYSTLAHLGRVLASAAPKPTDAADHGIDGYAWHPVAAQVGQLADDPAALSRGRKADVFAQLSSVLRRFGGNRTATPTLVQGGRLVAYVPPPHPRAWARRTELLVRTRSADEVLEAFVALQDAFPTEPITRTYAGETLLWLGRYPDAEAQLREALALDRATVWAWIGLGAARMLQGALDEALEIWAEGVEAVSFEGPTLFVYRAEAHWRRGDLDAAIRDLDVALGDKPHRLAAWVLRALVDVERGRMEGARTVAATIAARAPGLWSDAADHAGRDRSDPDAVVPVLTAALGAMRGNRSSASAAWFSPDEHQRFTSWGRFLDPAEVFPDFDPGR